jgi:hypothetical protein
MGAKPAGYRQSEKLSAEEAQALTLEIADLLSVAYAKVAPLIVRAFRGRAWVAVGCTSWDEYCRENFRGPRMLRFSKAQLTELCADLAGEGMSVRAIGSAFGVGHATAARAVNASGRKPADVIGLDDRRQKRDRELTASRDAHPAGKAEPVTVADLRPAETILLHITMSEQDGLTYVELCDLTGWRDAPVTGALSGLARANRITVGRVRGGHVAWVLADTDVR